MQIAGTEQSRPPVTVLGPSLALDLSWAGYAADYAPLRAMHPVLDRLYADRDDLAGRLRELWGDGPTCFPELAVLAHHAGALEVTGFAELRAAAEAALPSVPGDLPLRSETPADRAAILSRLAQLRDAPARRRRYFDALAALWSGLEAFWTVEGMESVERAAADAERELQRGGDWTQLVRAGECEALQRHMPEIVERHRSGLGVVLASCAFFGKALYLDLPGCVLVGIGATNADVAARARTGRVALRLRALADPTRLAIFDHLAGGPSSVGEIARVFSLAQPTVSTHVKHLREAGLVSAERQGTRLEVSVDRAASERLAEEVAGLLSR